MKRIARILTHEPGHGLAIIPEGSLRRQDGRIDYDYVKRIYGAMLPEILAAGERWIDPYFVDWLQVFTPIEYSMWSLIRSQPIPFYPQVPVGRRFVDFGNPCKRIAIECDGRAWHSAARDFEREEELLEAGWWVFRFTGRTCLRIPSLPAMVCKHVADGGGPFVLGAGVTDQWLEELLDQEATNEQGEWLTEESVD